MSAPILESMALPPLEAANTNDHRRTGTNKKSGQEVAKQKTGGFSKTDSRYWLSRLFRNTFTHDGVKQETADWCARISRKGHRETFNLETPNREAAAKKAQAIYLSLVANGWPDTLAKYKPKGAKPSQCASIGELLAEIEATSGLRASTFSIYSQALRLIASEIEGIGDQPYLGKDGTPEKDAKGKPILMSRFDYKAGGRAAWVSKVNAVRLDVLAPDKIQRWRLAYLKKVGSAPDAQRRASNSVNAHLRNARSLFGEKALKHARNTLCLPDPLPFADVTLEKRGNTRYSSQIDAKKLLQDAMAELVITDDQTATLPQGADTGDTPRRVKPGGQCFKIFCLGLLCGLRKREIDSLLWRQVDFNEGKIHIEATEYFHPKSEDSIGEVDLDAELLALLRGWKATAKGPFVIESKNAPRYHVSRVNYRCEAEFVALYKWLKSKGITARKKLHELRKELGAILASEQGIFAAQQMLRHADIRTTSQYYADKKQRITAGLGNLLKQDTAVIEFKPERPRTHESKDKLG